MIGSLLLCNSSMRSSLAVLVDDSDDDDDDGDGGDPLFEV